MTAPSDAIIEKIKKILARADTSRGATQAEAETAMRKVQELAIEHNIDLSTVSVDGEIKVGEIETDHAEVKTATKQERPYHLPILAVLRECFDVRGIVNCYTDHNSMRIITKITFVGEKLDVQLATYCWSWLEQLFPKAWLDYRKQYGLKDSWTSARSFFAGFRDGLIDNNRRQRQEVSGQQADRFALVVVNKQEVVAAKVAEMFPNMGNLKSFTTRQDFHARMAGNDAGRRIKLTGGLTSSQNAGRIQG